MRSWIEAMSGLRLGIAFLAVWTAASTEHCSEKQMVAVITTCAIIFFFAICPGWQWRKWIRAGLARLERWEIAFRRDLAEWNRQRLGLNEAEPEEPLPAIQIRRYVA